jgi:hypothetical protein
MHYPHNTAGHEPAQQCRAAARDAAVARAVLRHVLPVPLVSVSGNVGRQGPTMQYRRAWRKRECTEVHRSLGIAAELAAPSGAGP